MQQTTSTVLMVPPYDFSYNLQTAQSNYFQRKFQMDDCAKLAMQEYAEMVRRLRVQDIQVLTLDTRSDVPLPDAVFPNNWFSVTLEDGIRHLWLYPMLTPNRRAERRVDLLLETLKQADFVIHSIHDLSILESAERALEGTGSLVFDHEHRLCFAAISPRTDASIVESFVQMSGYKSCCFTSFDTKSRLIYHTNVMLSIGKQFVVCAVETIAPLMREAVLQQIESLGKTLIKINQAQVLQMCANILEVKNKKGDPFIVMSSCAHQNFSKEQCQQLEKHASLLVVDIPTIEQVGGGSARCMLAEIF